jgi:hypothetical protein
VRDVLGAMRLISAHPGHYAALSVAYVSCNDVSDEVEREYEQIRRTWDAAN